MNPNDFPVQRPHSHEWWEIMCTGFSVSPQRGSVTHLKTTPFGFESLGPYPSKDSPLKKHSNFAESLSLKLCSIVSAQEEDRASEMQRSNNRTPFIVKIRV